MLKYISIHHYTVADEVELDLHQGMTVITGETGAGKSIMIDALELCLGARADSDAIRNGYDQFDVITHFDISSKNHVQQWLAEHELSSENECIIRRIVKRDGRSISMINGRSVPLHLTRQLAEQLVTIHGQHEYHGLFKRDTHRAILDNYAKHQDLLNTVQEHFYSWQNIQHDIEKLTSQIHDQTRIDFISFQMQELNELNLQEGELIALEQEHRQLMHADEILKQCQSTLDKLNENDDQTITRQLNQCSHLLDKLITLIPALKSAHELLSTALINCQEAANEIEHYLSKMERNPHRLDELEKHLEKIYQIARKHRIQPQQIPSHQKQLKRELEELTERDSLIEKLKLKLDEHAEHYFKAAKQLSENRQKIAKKLSKEITGTINQLGMPQAKFEIQLEKIENSLPQLYGMEMIEFHVTTNPGTSLQSLKKIVSGGELSRISLAIQVITAQSYSTPTLLFDEVDVGIGGAIAEIVGQLLRKLSENHQIICVTHQAQVAVQGHQHLLVEKKVINKVSSSSIRQLINDEKVDEIARMIGGQHITEKTRAHAKELVASV